MAPARLSNWSIILLGYICFGNEHLLYFLGIGALVDVTIEYWLFRRVAFADNSGHKLSMGKGYVAAILLRFFVELITTLPIWLLGGKELSVIMVITYLCAGVPAYLVTVTGQYFMNHRTLEGIGLFLEAEVGTAWRHRFIIIPLLALLIVAVWAWEANGSPDMFGGLFLYMKGPAAIAAGPVHMVTPRFRHHVF